eukprot:g11394.t1
MRRRNERKLRVLELGAGTGWMGLTLAANYPDHVHVTLTDLAHALPALRTNSKETACAPGGGYDVRNATTVAPLDWADFAPGGKWSCGRSVDGTGTCGVAESAGDRGDCGAEARAAAEAASAPGEFDLVIGTELAWQMVGARALPWVLRYFRSRGSRVVYGHQPAYSQAAHNQFLETCKEAGVLLQDRTVEHDVKKAFIGGNEVPVESDCEDVDADDGGRLFQMLFPQQDDDAGKNSARQGFAIYEVGVQNDQQKPVF